MEQKPRLHYNVLGTARVPLGTVPHYLGTANRDAETNVFASPRHGYRC